MRKSMWAVTAAALLVAGVSPAYVMAESAPAAKPKSAVAAPAKPKLGGEMARIAKVNDLSPEQLQKLEALAGEYNEAIRQWTTTNKEALAKAKADASSSDEEAKKSAGEANKKLMAERRVIDVDYTIKALALLTPDQRSSYEANKVASGTQSRLAKSNITLTADQKAKINAIALEAFKGVDASDAAAVKKANSTISSRVNKEVLTDEQRAQLPQPAAKAKPAADKAKPKAQ